MLCIKCPSCNYQTPWHRKQCSDSFDQIFRDLSLVKLAPQHLHCACCLCLWFCALANVSVGSAHTYVMVSDIFKSIPKAECFRLVNPFLCSLTIMKGWAAVTLTNYYTTKNTSFDNSLAEIEQHMVTGKTEMIPSFWAWLISPSIFDLLPPLRLFFLREL